jgi:hypothetical protein
MDKIGIHNPLSPRFLTIINEIIEKIRDKTHKIKADTERILPMSTFF